jgi:drug/metabolite transporter (DMT)-like permease
MYSATVTRRVWILVIGTGLAWGTGGLISKWLVLDGIDPFAVTALPFAVAALLASIETFRHSRPSRAALITGAQLGLLNVAIPPLLFNLGYETLPAGVVTLLLSVGPVLTAVAANFSFSDEPLSLAKGAGLVLAIAGVVALSADPSTIPSGGAIGVIYVLVGVVVASATAVWVRKATVKHGAINIFAPELLVAAPVPILLAPLFGRSIVPAGGFTGLQGIAILAIGIIGGYGGFRMILKANQIGTTGQVSMVAYVLPVIGVMGGRILFDEPFTTGILLGGVLILSGIAVAGRASASTGAGGAKPVPAGR